MKNFISKKKRSYLSLMLLGMMWFCAGNGFSQVDIDPEPAGDCWCRKTVMLPDGQMRVYDIEAHPEYDITFECNSDDCSSSVCGFQKFMEIYNVETGETDRVPDGDEEEGDCTTQDRDGDIPWDTTGVTQGDCQCIWEKHDENGRRIFFNISVKDTISDSGFTITEPCNSDDCGNATCKFTLTRGGISFEKEGFCTTYWPSGGESSMPATVSIREDEEQVQFSFFPNPATNTLVIMGSNNITTQIFSMNGTQVLESSAKTIDIQSLASGTYIVQLTDGKEIFKDVLVVE